MLSIHPVDLSDALELFCESPPLEGMTPTQCAAFCRRRCLVAFAAERDDNLVGFAVAESDPNGVAVLNLEGDIDACRLLLGRLVRLAGERDVTSWCPADRPDVVELLEARGFSRECRDDFLARPSFLYCLYRPDA